MQTIQQSRNRSHGFKPVWAILVVTATLVLVSPVHADLILNISDAGGGTTRWEFSGSATVTSSSSFNSSGLYGIDTWTGGIPAAVTDTSNFSTPPISGSGTITIDGVTAAVDGRGYHIGGSHYFGMERVGNVVYDAGDVISWSGDLVFNAPISDFVPGTHSTRNIFGGGVLDGLYIVNIGPVAAVPEPASLAIWSALGGLGLAAALRRRKRLAEVSTRHDSPLASNSGRSEVGH